MIKWRDEAVIIGYRRHGESGAIIELLTRKYGRHLGMVRGGGSKKRAASLQPGNLVDAEYSARLPTHLGSFRIEVRTSHLRALMDEPLRLAGFNAMSAMTRFSTEERDPHPLLFGEFLGWFTAKDPARFYLDWELVLLSEAGFALGLTACALTGRQDGLAYISPNTGRAVTHEAAGEWAERLIPFPKAYRGEGGSDAIIEALRVNEYFLINKLARSIGKAELPKARDRFLAQLEANAAPVTPRL